MFGFLKKKLKEGIENISKTVSEKEEEKIQQAVQEVEREEHVETPKELVQEVEREIEKTETEPEVSKQSVEESKPVEEEIEEELGEPEKIVEELEKEVEPESKIEKAEEVIETAKEIERVEENVSVVESSEQVKPEVAAVKEKPKRGLLGLFRRKPKEEKVIEKPVEVAEEKGIIDKIKKKITEKKIEEEDVKGILSDFEMGLLSSDVALEASDKIIGDLRSNLVGKFIKRGEVESVIKNSFRDSLMEILSVPSFDLVERAKTKKPFVIVFLGFNGVGKTTSMARIGYLLKNKGLSCVFAAADSWRAAAIEQLEEHGKKLGIEVVKHDYGADPAAVIFDAVKHAKAKGVDVVLADTAGRSHANANLMDELKKIIKVNKPDLKILVLDALTGNDIYDQCKLFNEAVGVDGLILTKADVYEKGGAAISASFTIKKPILYLGVGQEYENLERFEPEKIVNGLLE